MPNRALNGSRALRALDLVLLFLTFCQGAVFGVAADGERRNERARAAHQSPASGPNQLLTSTGPSCSAVAVGP